MIQSQFVYPPEREGHGRGSWALLMAQTHGANVESKVCGNSWTLSDRVELVLVSNRTRSVCIVEGARKLTGREWRLVAL
jgi:hypothetical protein